MSAQLQELVTEALPSRAPEVDEAWIGLGSNVGDRAANLRDALQALRELGADIVLVSPVFETEPWGIRDQAWFLNAVARLRWTGGGRALLEHCLHVERQLGRVRQQKNGPRVIDLDVLLAGDVVVNEAGLVVPHPGIATRRSVLEPWAAVAPELLVPGQSATLGALRARAHGLPGQGARLSGLTIGAAPAAVAG